MNPIQIEGETFIAVTLKLPKTNFMAVTNDTGYIMCGALDINLFNTNQKLIDRKIVAGRAVGVRTIDQLLEAPLESVTLEAEQLGITAGMKGKDALLKMKDS
ncbi:YunC family protein [Alkalihalobacillus sp. MEB130]|uniref:YunC family protein n=1 Tax=Alkalihalobacillus sp. MEB130 TaxID=2976704 RepID=UPI0037BEB555